MWQKRKKRSVFVIYISEKQTDITRHKILRTNFDFKEIANNVALIFEQVLLTMLVTFFFFSLQRKVILNMIGWLYTFGKRNMYKEI